MGGILSASDGAIGDLVKDVVVLRPEFIKEKNLG